MRVIRVTGCGKTKQNEKRQNIKNAERQEQNKNGRLNVSFNNRSHTRDIQIIGQIKCL